MSFLIAYNVVILNFNFKDLKNAFAPSVFNFYNNNYYQKSILTLIPYFLSFKLIYRYKKLPICFSLI